MYQGLLTGGRPQTTLTNIVTGGNFPNTTGWTGINSTLAASNNILSITGNGTSPSARALGLSNVSGVDGKKIYVRALQRVTNSVSTQLRLDIRSSNEAVAIMAYSEPNPVQNQWYQLSGVVTLGATFTGLTVCPYLLHSYADAATANGKVMEVKKVLAIDLTSAFGAGYEPTAAQMTRWIDIFSAGWFDTTKSIPKRIY